MAETSIKVENVEPKQTKNGNQFYLYQANDGKTYTNFNNTLHQTVRANMEADVEFKIEYEEKQQGIYTNYIISNVADASGNMQAETKKKYSGGGRGKDTRSIERQVSLKEANALIISMIGAGGQLKPEEAVEYVIDVAETYDDYLQAKK